jgi:homoserine dehydrogenase
MPTASAVVADLMEIAREVQRGVSGRVAPLSTLPKHIAPKPLVPEAERACRAFLRMTARDQPGIVGVVTSALGDQGVGVDSVIARDQPGASSGLVSVIVLTHVTTEEALQRALDRISALPEISGSPRLIRIEEEV